MKTPRQILFERHRQAESKLDAIRQEALSALTTQARDEGLRTGLKEGFWFGTMLRKAWLELIWPSRGAWAALAALWLAIGATNLEMKSEARTVPVVRSEPVGEMVNRFKEQERLLAELLQPFNPSAGKPARPMPRPRSEWWMPYKSC
jgi:hypothetical protein